jgi:hypothetical protein
MTQEEQINELADAVSMYFKALIKRNVPTELAHAIVSDWHLAYVQDVLDERHNGRIKPPILPYRRVRLTQEDE